MYDMYDYHLHSTHSGDGKVPDIVQAMAAIERGVKEICFTDHFDVDFPNAPTMDFEVDIPTYHDDIQFVREQFSDKLSVKWGIEVGMQPDERIMAETNRRLAGWEFDYMIASVHCNPGNDYHRASSWEGVTKQDVLKTYIALLKYGITHMDRYSCIGHLTYYSRYTPQKDRMMTYQDAPDEIDDLFKLIIQSGHGIEINTSVYDTLGFFLPDYDIIRRVKQAVSIPVIGNGDVVDEASAAKMAELTDCDAIMIGRGAMGNPWLFRRINAYFDECRIIPEPSVEEKVRVMLAHIQKMIEYKGEHTAMREARRHAAYYTKGLRGGAKFRAEMGSLESFEQLCEITFRIVKENQ